MKVRGAQLAVLVWALSQLMACGFKGPLVAADAEAPAGKESVATSKAPDAASAAPPIAQDAERVIDKGDAGTDTP
ncbi:MAG: hypothetical protein ABIP49_11175 [Lysobacterales bacterium]